jgi:5-methylthioadenosine/S-adenosylhomocysteine deaminase
MIVNNSEDFASFTYTLDYIFAKINDMQILHPKWIVPIIPRQAVLTDQSIVIDAGKIAAILPTAEARLLTGKHVDLSEHIVMPGLINSHTHVPMNLFRGYADDLHLNVWLNDHLWPLEGQYLSPDFCYDGTLVAIGELIKGGVTCFNDMYFFTTNMAEAIEKSKIRAAIGLHFFDCVNSFAKNIDECIEYAEKHLAEFAHNPLIQKTMALHAPYTVSDESLRKSLDFARKHHLKINMHVQETAKEVADSIDQYGMTPIQRLNKFGALNKDLIAVHVTQLNDEDLALLAAKKVSVVHCPESNLKLASGFCDIARLMAAGINVALGTDSAASNNDLDMFAEMRLAALLSKGITQNPVNIPAHVALELATINGARALGIEHQIGSVEVGKDADLIAVHVGNIESLPVYNPISHLVYATSNRQVTDVWVKGVSLLKNKQLTTLDENELENLAYKWQAKIQNKS